MLLFILCSLPISQAADLQPLGLQVEKNGRYCEGSVRNLGTQPAAAYIVFGAGSPSAGTRIARSVFSDGVLTASDVLSPGEVKPVKIECEQIALPLTTGIIYADGTTAGDVSEILGRRRALLDALPELQERAARATSSRQFTELVQVWYEQRQPEPADWLSLRSSVRHYVQNMAKNKSLPEIVTVLQKWEQRLKTSRPPL